MEGADIETCQGLFHGICIRFAVGNRATRLLLVGFIGLVLLDLARSKEYLFQHYFAYSQEKM